MYYKGCWFSEDIDLPGLYVSGGRNSDFACYYWTIKNNQIDVGLLWTYKTSAVSSDMIFTEISDNKQQILDSKKLESQCPEGTVDFLVIDEEGIQKLYSVDDVDELTLPDEKEDE